MTNKQNFVSLNVSRRKGDDTTNANSIGFVSINHEPSNLFIVGNSPGKYKSTSNQVNRDERQRLSQLIESMYEMVNRQMPTSPKK
jgi:hypothetical protein